MNLLVHEIISGNNIESPSIKKNDQKHNLDRFADLDATKFPNKNSYQVWYNCSNDLREKIRTVMKSKLWKMKPN